MTSSDYSDISFWQAIVDANFAVPADQPVEGLSRILLGWLGASDPTLRDRYAYPILEHWLHAGVFAADDVRRMIAHLAANLTHGLGERESDSVFLRSFSVLLLAEIIHYDNAHELLDAEEVRQVLELALVYLDAERDLRGWVHGKGWAHSVAHTADLLFVLSRSRWLGATELSRILDAVAAKLAAGGAFSVCGEDDRLARALTGILERNHLSAQAIRDWLARLVEAATIRDWLDAEAVERRLDVAHNTKQTLRSLFAALVAQQDRIPQASELAQAVLLAAQSLAA